MAKPIIKKVICPNCGTENDFTLYLSINVDLHPELYEKMLNGDLDIWECPKCRKKLQYKSLKIPEDKSKELGLSWIIESLEDVEPHDPYEGW